MRLISRILLLALVLCVGFIPVHAQGMAKANKGQKAKARHCVIRVEAVKAGEESSKVSEPVCFDTVEEARASASGDTLLATDYLEPNYKGDAFSYYGTDGKCSSLLVYTVPTLDSRLNNLVSSTKGASDSGCTYNTLYDSTLFISAKKTCKSSCSSLGSMDNKASSRVFSSYSYLRTRP